MSDAAFTPAQLAQIETVIRRAVREEFAGAGLRLDDTAHQDAAKEDFRFIRRLRLTWDAGVSKVGTAVLLAAVGVVGTIATMGLWAWISANLPPRQ